MRSSSPPPPDDPTTDEKGLRHPETLPSTPSGGHDDETVRVFTGPSTQPQVGAYDLAAQLPREDEAGFASRYDLQEPLGTGGMGEVVRCHDLRVGRDVALKRLLPTREQPDAVERFVREARVQGRLQHPAIVPVHDLGVDPESRPYFVMKRVRGRTLAEVLHGQASGDAEMLARFDRRTLLNAISRVCLAMQYAHEHGVIHRDLKPANLMLGDFGEVYVLDWGVARVEGAGDEASDAIITGDVAAGQTRAGAVLGTVGYAAPEQIRGGVIDGRADVYGMGVVLYEVLTLRRLFGSGTANERMAKTLEGVDGRPSAVRPDVAPELDQICRRALQLRPRDRFASMREMHDAIERYLSGERDEALRQELAEAHEARAEALLEDALGETLDGPLALEPRENALTEIGRALALGRESAMRLFFRVAEARPPTPLEDVDQELHAIQQRRTRRALMLGFWSHVAFLLFLPALALQGIRELTPLLVELGCVTGMVITCLLLARKRGPIANGWLYLVLFWTTTSIAVATRAFGPLFLAPQLMLGTNFIFMLTDSRRDRIRFAILGSLAVFGPLALEFLGWLPSSYAFGPDGLTILPQVIDFPAGPTLALLTGGTMMVLLVTSLSASALRDELEDTQRAAVFQAWHMRRLFGLHTSAGGPPSPAEVRER